MARSSRPLKRRPGAAAEAKTIAIVCEGRKTEGIYFNGIRREFRLTTAQLHVVELGADPLRVVQEAESLRRNHDETWAVFDVEAPGAHAIPHARLNQAVEKISPRSGRTIRRPCETLARGSTVGRKPSPADRRADRGRRCLPTCRAGGGPSR
ncbi:hypothetical protein Areg01_47980 [Actinoplanes regularis]|nr:hypothetical protein Areg01_47980 [Actinoplanes regularis]